MKHFVYKTLDELRQAAEELGTTNVRFETDPERVKAALTRKVRGRSFTLGNSMAIHPMEGCDGTHDGTPGELTWRRYGRFGRGGPKLIWFEATAVCKEGRANPRQLWIHDSNVDEFARVLEMARQEHQKTWGSTGDLLEPLQLTHSGRYSAPRRIIAYHNPLLDSSTNLPPDYPILSDDQLERLEDDYVDAARLAVRAGFRAVDIKTTHGYLLNELLGATTREGRYGGSLENRTRMIKNIIGKIRAALGNKLILCMRLGCFDGIPYEKDAQTGLGVPVEYRTPYRAGWGVDAENPLEPDLTEVKQAIGWFREWGVELMNISLGCPYNNPHIGRPFEKPDDGSYEQPEHPMFGVDRHFRVAGELQRAFPDLPMVGTGYSWLQIYGVNAAAANVEDGRISLYGIGRNALAYPDYVHDLLEKGHLEEGRVCKTLTYCTFLMRQKNHPLGQFPSGCPPFDKAGYGQIVKEAYHSRRVAKK